MPRSPFSTRLAKQKSEPASAATQDRASTRPIIYCAAAPPPFLTAAHPNGDSRRARKTGASKTGPPRAPPCPIIVARSRVRARSSCHGTPTGHSQVGTFARRRSLRSIISCELARRGFFNNISFHRVVPTSWCRAATARATATAAPVIKIRCEINEGVPSIARSGHELVRQNTAARSGSSHIAAPPPRRRLHRLCARRRSMETVDRITRGDRILSINVARRPRNIFLRRIVETVCSPRRHKDTKELPRPSWLLPSW